MRVPLIHPTDERQVPDLRAVPVPPRPASQPGRREHAPAVLAFLRGIDAADTTPAGLGMRRPAAPTPPEPIVLTDWSKKLAWTWAYAESAVAVLVKNTKAKLGADRNAVGALFAPLTDELADFAAELDDDRAAVFADLNAERVMVHDGLAELAPFADAVKAGA